MAICRGAFSPRPSRFSTVWLSPCANGSACDLDGLRRRPGGDVCSWHCASEARSASLALHASALSRAPIPPPRLCRTRSEAVCRSTLPWPFLRPAHICMCDMGPFSHGGALPRRPWRRALLTTSGESPSTGRGWVWKHCIRAPTLRSLTPQLTLHYMTARHPLPQLATVVAPFFPPHPPRSCPSPHNKSSAYCGCRPSPQGPHFAVLCGLPRSPTSTSKTATRLRLTGGAVRGSCRGFSTPLEWPLVRLGLKAVHRRHRITRRWLVPRRRRSTLLPRGPARMRLGRRPPPPSLGVRLTRTFRVTVPAASGWHLHMAMMAAVMWPLRRPPHVCRRARPCRARRPHLRTEMLAVV